MSVRIAGLFASTAAAPDVATTSTGPRLASSAMSGVVRTASPRNAVWMTREVDLLVNLQDGQERLLRNLYCADLLHPLLSFLLLFEKLALARDVAAVALRKHVLAKRLYRRTRDDLVADRGLDGNFEQLARDQVLQLVGDLAAVVVRLVLVDDHCERVHRIAVDEHVELHQIALAILDHVVVQ